MFLSPAPAPIASRLSQLNFFKQHPTFFTRKNLFLFKYPIFVFDKPIINVGTNEEREYRYHSEFLLFLSKAEPEPGMTAGQVLPVQYRTYHGRLQPPVKPLFGLEPEP